MRKQKLANLSKVSINQTTTFSLGCKVMEKIKLTWRKKKKKKYKIISNYLVFVTNSLGNFVHGVSTV